jgi:hypothetical protein
MPTRKVWSNLIKRGTQIKDFISELNPKEAKHKVGAGDGDAPPREKITFISG